MINSTSPTMAYILKNKNLELFIDAPFENYKFSRFDWTGKITKVKFQNILISSVENTSCENENILGKGFYNEFGIDAALGFNETKIGGWFHKIGIGLLKKEDTCYNFNKSYEIKPADFKIISEPNKLIINCKSANVNGYSYLLKKEIELLDSSFNINYYLKNTGEKDIITNEYVHNFIAINNEEIGSNYILKFPFQIKPELFEETVNPEQKVAIKLQEINFNNTPKEQFFFSNLNGSKAVTAQWELTNLKNDIIIKETGNFKTTNVNLWGWQHVICPELFYNIHLKPGKSTEWSRKYNLFKLA